MEIDWKEAFMNNLDHPQAPTLSATLLHLPQETAASLFTKHIKSSRQKPLSNPCLLANNSNICVHPHLLSLSQRNCVFSSVHVCHCCLNSESLCYLHRKASLLITVLKNCSRIKFSNHSLKGENWSQAEEQTQDWFFKRILDFCIRVYWECVSLPYTVFSTCGSREISVQYHSLCQLFCLINRVSHPVSLFVLILGSSELALWSDFGMFNMYPLLWHTEFSTDFIFSYLSSFSLFSSFLF